jgi:sugar phosphate isomerase/epimerase
MFYGLSTALYYDSRDISVVQVDSIRDSGIDLLEIAPNQEVSGRVLAHIKDSSMEVFSIHADYLNSDLSSNDEDFRQKSIETVKSVIKQAAGLGARLVVVHPGKWTPNKKERERRLSNCVKSLIEVVGYAAGNKIKIAIENLPCDFLCDNPVELDYVLSSVRDHFLGKEKQALAASIGICIDTGHAFLTGHLDELILKFGADIFSMHIHDNKGDNGSDRSVGLDDLHYVPGYGNIDWGLFFRDLKKMKYPGPLIFEVMSINGDKEDKARIFQAIKGFMMTSGAVDNK